MLQHLQKIFGFISLAIIGLAAAYFTPSSPKTAQTADCLVSTSRPCYDRVTPGKTIGLNPKAGENSFKACLQSKSPSLRGFAQIKTALSELEQYQYCFEGKSMVQIRYFTGSGAEPPPAFSCVKSPQFSTLSLLDPNWNVSDPQAYIDNLYTYYYIIEAMLKSQNGIMFAGGVRSASSGGWIPVMNKSTDNGISWKPIQLPDPPPDWGFVYAMAEDHNGVLYAGGTAFWKSTDGGNTWSKLPMPYPNTYWGGFVPANVITVAKDNSLIVSFGSGGPADPSSYYPSKVFKSVDGGMSWNKLFDHPYYITSIVESGDALVFRDSEYGNPGGVYRYAGGIITKVHTDGAAASVPNAGILKASDDNLYFISVDSSADIYVTDYLQPGNAYLAAYKSADNGKSWTKLGGLPNSWTIQGPIVETPDGVFYAASYSVCEFKDTLYRSADKGITWNAAATSPEFGSAKLNYWYYYWILSLVDASGNILIGGNAPVIFLAK